MLFPAYAGVIQLQALGLADIYAFPRLRGGDPEAALGSDVVYTFSPPTRG